MSRRKSCIKSKQRRSKKSKQRRKRSCKKSLRKKRSCIKSKQRRRRSCKRSKEDGVKRKRSLLLTEKIPTDIDKYEYDVYDVDDNIYDELKPTDLEFLLHDSDVETIPEESLEEYKALKPPKRISNIFKTLEPLQKKSRRSLLLSEKIPENIDKYEYDEYDVEDNIYDELKPDDLEFLLYDSVVETIPEESLEEYKALKPLKKMNESFNRKYYKCPECKEFQYSRGNLTEHFLKVHKKSMYICPEEDCNYKSARLTDLNKHKVTKHKK